MKTKPFLVTASAYCTTSTRFVLPALAIAPSDFSRMVVRPPALLPGDGLALISAPCWAVYSSHQRISVDELLADLAADRAAREQVLGAIGLGGLGEDDRAAVAHDEIARDAKRRIGGDAGVAVRAAALQGDRQVARRRPARA